VHRDKGDPVRNEIMRHFDLIREFQKAGYFETEHLKEIFGEVKAAIKLGKLVAISGIVGSGKTLLLKRLQDHLAQEKEVLIAKSLSLDKRRVTISTLLLALFMDLSAHTAKEKEIPIPTQSEKQIRKLQEIIRKSKKPVVLFVDEAHDLHGQTLRGLKRLMEVIEEDDGLLSVVLAGHPKLKNDLRRSSMEEIGHRMTVFNLDGIVASKREYLEWLLEKCTKTGTAVDTVFSAEAIDLLADRLVTPLQIEHYLTLAVEEAFTIGVRPVTAEIVASVIAKDIDELESRLTRLGYNARILAPILNVRPAVLQSFFQGQLPPGRMQELQNEMLAVGIPI
jgi:type II secretory pathway predicted ATPase ExeA